MTRQTSKNQERNQESVREAQLENRYVVLKPETHGERYRAFHYLVVRCTGGFGCTPNALGRKIFVRYVHDREKSYVHRGDIARFATPEEVGQVVAARPQLIYPDGTLAADGVTCNTCGHPAANGWVPAPTEDSPSRRTWCWCNCHETHKELDRDMLDVAYAEGRVVEAVQ